MIESATLPDGRRCQRYTERNGARRYMIERRETPGEMRGVPLGAKDLRKRIDEAIDKAAT